VFCGKTAAPLGVDVVEKIIFTEFGTRYKVQNLASLMFPGTLKDLWLRKISTELDRKIFPMDAKLAIISKYILSKDADSRVFLRLKSTAKAYLIVPF